MPWTYKQIQKELKQNGFDLLRRHDGREFWHNPTTKKSTTLYPHGGSKEVPPGTLGSIRRQSGLGLRK